MGLQPAPKTTDPPQSLSSGSRIVRGVSEVVVAALVVLAIAGGLSLIARWRAESRAAAPIVPDAAGVLTLRPYRATITGDLKRFPTELEAQTADFSYTHGRKVLAERQERKVGGWTAAEASVQWQFTPDRSGEYKVRVRYAGGDDVAGSTIRVDIGEVSLQKSLESTGGRDQWASLPVGRVDLDAGRTYHLRVQPAATPSNHWIDLDYIKLTPLEAPASR